MILEKSTFFLKIAFYPTTQMFRIPPRCPKDTPRHGLSGLSPRMHPGGDFFSRGVKRPAARRV